MQIQNYVSTARSTRGLRRRPAHTKFSFVQSSTRTVWSSTPITARPSLSACQSKEAIGCVENFFFCSCVTVPSTPLARGGGRAESEDGEERRPAAAPPRRPLGDVSDGGVLEESRKGPRLGVAVLVFDRALRGVRVPKGQVR